MNMKIDIFCDIGTKVLLSCVRRNWYCGRSEELHNIHYFANDLRQCQTRLQTQQRIVISIGMFSCPLAAMGGLKNDF